MQTLARDGLTAEQVTAILTAPAVEVSAGCELLRPDLVVMEDISNDLAGGTVRRSNFADVHGTCSLALTRELVWGVDLIRPTMTLTAGDLSVTFRLGVYALTTPSSEVGDDPVTYDVTGFDRVYLLDRQIGESYTIPAGTTYRQALLDTFLAAGLSGVLIEGAAADDVLPAAYSRPLVANSADPDQTNTPATWLRVVNDLLRAINFRSVYADADGLLRCQAYQPPADRAIEFVFDADHPATILAEDRRVTQDVYAAPNVWVFRQTNRPDGAPVAVEGDGIYTVVNQSDGPTSVDARGLRWPSVIDFEAASQAKLVELGDRKVAIDRAVTATFDVRTGPFPPAGHFDVFTYADLATGGSRKVQAVAWELPLDGGDTTWTWEAV